ncbi:MAG: hypothetical protein R2909_24260 [Gemmatimonadales bacterium]
MLAAVAQLAPDAYGVTVRSRVGAMSGGTPPSVGAIHRAVTALERARLIRARSGDPSPVRGGRAKRMLTLTPAGATALEGARRRAATEAAALSARWRPV